MYFKYISIFLVICIIGLCKSDSAKQQQSNTDASGKPFWAARGRRSGVRCDTTVAEEMANDQSSNNAAEEYISSVEPFETKEFALNVDRLKRGYYYHPLGWRPSALRFLYPQQMESSDNGNFPFRKKNDEIPFWAARG